MAISCPSRCPFQVAGQQTPMCCFGNGKYEETTWPTKSKRETWSGLWSEVRNGVCPLFTTRDQRLVPELPVFTSSGKESFALSVRFCLPPPPLPPFFLLHPQGCLGKGCESQGHSFQIDPRESFARPPGDKKYCFWGMFSINRLGVKFFLALE
ncbi:uncharacterized protein CEXT_851 [Caerostris extrusa]|uniref:Uncharacterized protein n=1 Tax=Caerostris extrusa TaxID=172846 RepID=A0AAV4REV2_CAEEX|nr:uncharacterized protein CEXT_851 [Caerostris extrusa]